MLENKSILITGGTGSFGKKFIETILTSHNPRKVIVYSRDELKQFEMSNTPFFKEQKDKLRFFIGDVRDEARMRRACEDVDVIIHAAALKQVPAAEYNPMECIQTNIIGAQNVINAALENNVQDVVALSTDKAAAPVNLYGATKLCSDKLFTAANNMKGKRKLKFSVVRYGNVFGSRGSVVPFFLDKKDSGEALTITDENMTRFNITLKEGVDLVLTALTHAWGGEIFVPKIPSYKITTLTNAISPESKASVIGIRPGEKVHEEMITESDAFNTYDCGPYYTILPSVPTWNVAEFVKHFDCSQVPKGFKYNSGDNNEWLDEKQIRDLIVEHLRPNFTV